MRPLVELQGQHRVVGICSHRRRDDDGPEQTLVTLQRVLVTRIVVGELCLAGQHRAPHDALGVRDPVAQELDRLRRGRHVVAGYRSDATTPVRGDHRPCRPYRTGDDPDGDVGCRDGIAERGQFGAQCGHDDRLLAARRLGEQLAHAHREDDEGMQLLRGEGQVALDVEHGNGLVTLVDGQRELDGIDVVQRSIALVLRRIAQVGHAAAARGVGDDPVRRQKGAYRVVVVVAGDDLRLLLGEDAYRRVSFSLLAQQPGKRPQRSCPQPRQTSQGGQELVVVDPEGHVSIPTAEGLTEP